MTGPVERRSVCGLTSVIRLLEMTPMSVMYSSWSSIISIRIGLVKSKNNCFAVG